MRDLDRSITLLIVVITAALELFQAVMGFNNNWKYIETVYRCVRDVRPWHHRRRDQLWWCWKKRSITPPTMNYWEDNLGEYVLLKGFNHRPWVWNLLSWLTLFLVEPRRQGQKRERTKHLPPEVSRAVLNSFKAWGLQLTNGTSTIGRHGVSSHLEWACAFAMRTDQILAWHIVTTRCDWAGGRSRREDDAYQDINRVVATKLSNYCAYLIAFVPEMLPDPCDMAQRIFDTAVQQAREDLHGCKTESSVLARLQEIENKERRDAVYERAGSSTIIEKAALLGGQLRAAVGDEGRRWQVLAEFWAEFILFLAPSDNVDIHIEMLGAGGEFMTRLLGASIPRRRPGAAGRCRVGNDGVTGLVTMHV